MRWSNPLREGEPSHDDVVGDLGEGQDEGSGTEINSEIVLEGNLLDLATGSLHGVLKTTVNDVLLAGSSHGASELGGWGDWDLAREPE